MAKGLNKVMLIGNLGRDPEIRYTPDGLAIAKFSIATTERRKAKDGNYEDHTDWHRVTAFGKLGEICGEYLSKGSQVYIEGRISYGSYEKDGQTIYTTDIIASDMVMLGGNRGGGAGAGGSGRGGSKPSGPPQDDFNAPPYSGMNDDDIPF
ncbi:MAG: single-stranded DNA-binding protein [Desulfobacterales bacterium]